jgi:methyltransferase (TIGR00027 family)
MAATTSAPGGDAAAPLLKAKVALSGVSETLMVTLCARAEDAARPNSILRDTWAARVLDQLNYTYPRTLGDKGLFASVVLRARLLDAWMAEFLNAHPEATVLHLACGLDSRALRLAWGPRVRWIDVDLPDVVELRQQVFPPLGGDYRLVAASVTEDAWLEDVPADRPTAVVMEGLLPYLERAEAERLVERICARFPSGQIMFEIVGRWFLRLQALNRPIWRTGAVMRFGLDDERELLTVSPKLRVRDVVRAWQIPGRETFPWYLYFILWVYSWIPGLQTLISYLRYDF